MQDVKELFNLLQQFYDCQDWWPVHKDTDVFLEVSVGAILTQNTSWRNVEKAINNLIKENLLDWQKLEDVDIEKLKRCIKPAGFYNQKAVYIKNFVKKVKNLNKKNINRKLLLSIKGIGKETADSILLYGIGKPYFVVDGYTKRLFYRVGIINKKSISYEDLQMLVMKAVPPDTHTYRMFHAVIVEHCKRYCKKKPICEKCPVIDMCKQNLK